MVFLMEFPWVLEHLFTRENLAKIWFKNVKTQPNDVYSFQWPIGHKDFLKNQQSFIFGYMKGWFKF